MLDFADVVAINKFERRGAEDARRDVRPPAGPQPRGLRRRLGGDAGVRHVAPRASTTTASPRSTSTCAACWPSTGCRSATARCRTVAGRGVHRADRRRAGRPGALPGRGRRDGARLPRRRPRRRRPRPARAAPATARATARRRAAKPHAADRRRAAGHARRRGRPQTASTASPSWPAPSSRYAGAELTLRIRGQRSARRVRRTTLSGSASPASRSPATTDHGELVRFLRAENLPGRFPFTAGVFPFKREGEDPARMFAGEGDAVPHQPPLPPALRGPAGHPAVDRVRLGDALRPRPRPSGPTSTARSAPPACRSPRSTT